MKVQLEESGDVAQKRGPVFFSAGFRPFFLLAGVWAAVGLALWLALFFGAADLRFRASPVLWHGHEMVFGFAAAALGGFLLTAVPNWTGVTYLKGWRVALLTAAWAAGRLAMLAAGIVPPLAVAVLDLSFLPLLAVMLAPALIAAGKFRNLIFLPILGLFWAANLATHLEALGVAAVAGNGLRLGIWLLLLMISIVGGRIIGMFTVNGLRMKGRAIEIKAWPWLETALPIAMIVAALTDVMAPGTKVGGALALLTAVLQGMRLYGWRGWKSAGVPLVWVLHVGYLWLPVGLVLLGLSAFWEQIPPTAALHALTAGTIGTMILAVMSRAALGHSGRMLEPAKLTVAAYWLVTLATILRVVPPLLSLEYVPFSAAAAGGLWIAGWGAFTVAYWPICTQPRADGRPG